MISRRGFLIRAAGLLTAAFVKDARAFVRRTGTPLLAPPPPSTAHTLFWREDGIDELFLGLDGPPEDAPWEPPPTWREFLNRADAKSYEREDFLEALEELEPDQLDREMDEFWWQCHFQMVSGPIAKAHRLLKKINLGPALDPENDGPHLKFEPDWGSNWSRALFLPPPPIRIA